MKIIEYSNKASTDIDALTKHINAMLKEGWQPLGNIFIIRGLNEEFFYIQTIVKYEDENVTS